MNFGEDNYRMHRKSRKGKARADMSLTYRGRKPQRLFFDLSNQVSHTGLLAVHHRISNDQASNPFFLKVNTFYSTKISSVQKKTNNLAELYFDGKLFICFVIPVGK